MSGKILVKLNEPVGVIELNRLFKTNHWNIEDVSRLERSLSRAWAWFSARTLQGDLVGYVQVLSDGIRHAYILKMIVHPDFRNRGVGSEIMQCLMDYLESEKMLPTLVATKGNEAFYAKFGFSSISKGLTAMCIR